MHVCIFYSIWSPLGSDIYHYSQDLNRKSARCDQSVTGDIKNAQKQQNGKAISAEMWERVQQWGCPAKESDCTLSTRLDWVLEPASQLQNISPFLPFPNFSTCQLPPHSPHLYIYFSGNMHIFLFPFHASLGEKEASGYIRQSISHFSNAKPTSLPRGHPTSPFKVSSTLSSSPFLLEILLPSTQPCSWYFPIFN